MAAVTNHPSTQSADELASWVAQDSTLQQEVSSDPVGTLQRLAKPIESDRWIYRLVVGILGLTILGVVAGAFVLEVNNSGATIPDALLALGSAALGALAGLLTPFPKG
jgi:hypothetical protein